MSYPQYIADARVGDALAAALETAKAHREAIQQLQVAVAAARPTESNNVTLKRLSGDAQKAVAELSFYLEVRNS